MENARKLADCYFYYYSTCTKGDACNFRHEPEALGCESMCFYWQQGKCFDQHCKLRHMELRKNRKQIACYWETQPGGCRKKHCPFLHKNPQACIDGIAPSQSNVPLPVSRDVQQSGVNRETGEGPANVSATGSSVLHQAGPAPPNPSSDSGPHNAHLPHWQRQVIMEPGAMLRDSALDGQHGSIPPIAPMNPMSMAPINSMTPLAAAYSALQPVDSLVVNFEEESDTDSVTSLSPQKNILDEGKHSADLMMLEQIQEETAAFYSYDFNAIPNLQQCPSICKTQEEIAELRNAKRRLPMEYELMSLDELQYGISKGGIKRKNSDDFKILSLDEIRQRKRLKAKIDDSISSSDNSNRDIICDNDDSAKSCNNNRIKLKRKINNSSNVNISLEKIKKDCNNSDISDEIMDMSGALLESNNFDSITTNFNSDSITTNFNSDSSELIMEIDALSNSVPDIVSCCTRKTVNSLYVKESDILEEIDAFMER